MFSKKIIAGVILSGLITGYFAAPQQKPVEASVYVTDEQNIKQNTQTALNTAANAINTANHVALAVKNLTSMDSDALLAHYLGLDTQYKNIVSYLDEQVGAFDQSTSISTFLSAVSGGKTSPTAYRNSVKKLYHVADNTYSSALKVAKYQQQVETGLENLETAVKKLNNSQGQKEAQQAQGQIASQGIIEQSKANVSLSTLVGIVSTKNLAEIAEKQAQIKKNEETIADTQSNAKEVISEIEDNANSDWSSYQSIARGGW